MEESKLSQKTSSVDLYLNLLIKALNFSLWDETIFWAKDLNNRNSIKRILTHLATKVIKPWNFTLVKILDNKGRDEGSIWPGQAHTMIGTLRLKNIRYCVEEVIKNKILGDFIETGAWRGGRVFSCEAY